MKKILSTMMLFMLSSCFSIGDSKLSEMAEVQKTMQSKIISKDDLVKEFGEPTSIFEKKDINVYEYKYVSVYRNPKALIPIAGLFYDTNKYKTNYLYVYFNKDNSFNSFDTVSVEGVYEPNDDFIINKSKP